MAKRPPQWSPVYEARGVAQRPPRHGPAALMTQKSPIRSSAVVWCCQAPVFGGREAKTRCGSPQRRPRAVRPAPVGGLTTGGDMAPSPKAGQSSTCAARGTGACKGNRGHWYDCGSASRRRDGQRHTRGRSTRPDPGRRRRRRRRALVAALLDRADADHRGLAGRAGTGGGAARTAGTRPPRRLPRRHQRLRDLPLRETFGDDLPIIFTSGERVDPLDRTVGLMLGADDYIVKPYYPDELLARVRRFVTRASRLYFTPQARYELTPRELEVLAASRSRKSACGHRGESRNSPKTVSNHMQRLFSKLGVHSQAQAVAIAFHEKLLEEDAEPTPAGIAAWPARERRAARGNRESPRPGGTAGESTMRPEGR